MKNIEQMIKEMCPEGMKYFRIKDVFDNFSGMTGVSKKWADEGNCIFIDYLNVFNNLKVDVNNLPKATVKKFEQNILKRGDILLTCASETPRECAMSAVIEDEIRDNVFLDDHLFALRLKDDYKDKVNPTFINYYFYSPKHRVEVCKKVRGVTRFYVTNTSFVEIEIPLPPLEIQNEIVRILDKFTTLEAELEAELDCRKRQYEFYRDKLLTFNKIGGGMQEVTWMKMSEVAFYSKDRIDCNSLNEDTYVGVENMIKDKKGKIKASTVPQGKAIKYIDGDILIGNIRPYLKKIWKADSIGGTNGDVLCIRIKDPQILTSNYLFYVLSSDSFFKYDNTFAKGGKMPRGDKKAIMNFPIPIPSLSEQKRIADILDRFERLTADLTEGIPAEIAARRQQYEYYRDRLLTFKRKSA